MEKARFESHLDGIIVRVGAQYRVHGPGHFRHPCSRAPVLTTRKHGQSTRPVNTGVQNDTCVHGPYWRPVNSKP